MELRPRQGDLGQVFRLIKSHPSQERDLNNLKTSLRFPWGGLLSGLPKFVYISLLLMMSDSVTFDTEVVN